MMIAYLTQQGSNNVQMKVDHDYLRSCKKRLSIDSMHRDRVFLFLVQIGF